MDDQRLESARTQLDSSRDERQSSSDGFEAYSDATLAPAEEIAAVAVPLRSTAQEEADSSLARLLTSIDAAVLVLDTHCCIRRFTPAVLDLVDIRATDIGLPLGDLHCRFDDPELLFDARRAAEGSLPGKHELLTTAGRSFVRSITVSRTAENEIDGVVVSFLEVTALRSAEEHARQWEEQYRRIVDDAPVPMILQAADGQVLRLSSEWTARTGQTIVEVPTTDALLHLVDEPGASALAAWIGDLFTGAARSAEVEFSIRTKQGGHRDWVLQAGPPSTLEGRTVSLGVVFDITERKKIEAELRAACAAAEAATRGKDQLLANVSHELRTPLSVILLWADMLGASDMPAAARKEAIAAILRSAEAQRRLIDDLLDTTRITSGKLRVARNPIVLADVIRAAAEVIRPLAAAKGVGLDLDLDEKCVEVLGDAVRLEQVVWILLHNAVKFSPGGTSIRVTLQCPDESFELAVSDSGSGIAPEFLPHLFRPFSQAGDQAGKMRAGLGLGLSIARSIVELHEGTITASSAGEGLGATFTVRLPALAGEAAARTAAQDETAQRHLDGVRVHVVEDHEDTRLAICSILERAGAIVSAFANAEEALCALAGEHPRLILCDVGLPGMDGLELIRSVRELEIREGRPKAGAIAISALTTRSDHEAARAGGFDAFLAKPADAETTVATLRSVLDSNAS